MTDERFVELLEQRHLNLLAAEVSTATSRSEGASEANLDAETRTKLGEAEDCLRLIERVRRAETSPLARATSGATNDIALLGELVQSVAAGSTTGLGDGASLGRFKILRQLGQGGHAVVFLAWDPSTRREVALKTPRPDALFSEELRQRFVREGIAAARLSHPHIVTVYEVGQAGPIAYIVSAYCQGRSLATILAERVPIPVPLAAKWVEQLATGVEHAHGQGVWHRDVKPGNVLLEPIDRVAVKERDDERRVDLAGLTPKLTDFGLAKVREYIDVQTRTGALLGTPTYMAPEQVDGRLGAVGPATDVYGLGVILYEMLTGGPPFLGSSDADVLRQVANQEPRAPRSVRRELPRDLEAIVLACLEKSPERRYPSAGALAEDLARFRRGEPTRVRPLGPLRRGWKAVRLRPTRSIALALALLLPLVVLGGFVWHREALDRADAAASQLRQTSLNREQQLAEYRYANDVRLAYQAWQARDALQAVALLSRQIPAAAQTDRRGFFWWRLWSLVHGQPRVFGPADGSALAVSFSPDGATLCSAGQDGAIRLWNTNTGALEAELLGHTSDVNSVAFSPDGTWLVSAGDDRTLKIWHVAERRLEKTQQVSAAVNSVIFDPSGETLIIGDEQGEISLWRFDAVTRQQQLHGHTQEVNQLAISLDGSRLASAGSDGAIVLWNLQSLSQVAALKNHVGSVTAVAFSPDGQRLASAGVDHTVRLWQVDPPQMLFELRGHTQRIDSVAFSADGALLASAGKDGTLRLWDSSSGRIIWSYATEQSRVWSLAASPTSNLVATSGATGGVRLWPLDDVQRTATMRLPAFAASCDRCDFSLAGDEFTYFDSDRQLLVMNLVTGERRALAYDSAKDVQSVSFSPNGESVWVFDHFGNISAFDLHDGTLQRLSEIRGSRLQQKRRVSHNKRCVATSGGRSSRLLKLGNMHQFEREQRSIMLPSFAHDTLFTPDDKTLLLMLDGSAPGQPSMMLIDVATGKSGPLPWSQRMSVDSAAFSVDGQYLAYSGGIRQVWVRRWDDPAAEPVTLQASQFISSLAFSPGEPLLAAMGSDGTIFLWSLPDGQPIAAFELPTGPYHDLVFSRDGKWLAISFGSDVIPSELLLFAAPRSDDDPGSRGHDP